MVPAKFEFIEYEDVPLLETVSWKDTALLVLVITLFWISFQQFMTVRRANREFGSIIFQCTYGYDEVASISNFYTETEQKFLELEKRSNVLNSRFEKIKEKVPLQDDRDQIQEDVEYLKKSWFNQYSAFSLLDVDLLGTGYDGDLKHELNAIRGDFDVEVGAIEMSMHGDSLLLKDITRDVQMLESYFGQ
ncbi:uncharacterized protein LOC134709356 [Mytilus trossulus]|uniref:uncharacterized protein LOC134709356 n=1 Tax=Mytilus trossulus TaxID=6551 RepID=UPI0030066348